MLLRKYGKIKDLDKTRIETDEHAVANGMELVKPMINPFDSIIEGLVHISSGIVANDDIKSDMSNMFQQGEACKKISCHAAPIFTPPSRSEKRKLFRHCPPKCTVKTRKVKFWH